MKTVVLRITAVFLVLGLLTSCSGTGASGTPAPSASADTTAQNSEDPQEQPQDSTPDTAAESEDPGTETISVSLYCDPYAYQDPNDDDYLHALTYATNNTDKTVQATVRCQAFDKERNVISAFDQFRGKYIEQYKTDLYIPAGASELPVAFTLPMGFKYDISKDKEMPEIDHLEFELLEIQEAEWPDLRTHFTPGEPEIKENHIYIYVKFDQEIADNYKNLYPDYTLLGYSNGKLTTICCQNSYPFGTSSMSVEYAKEHNDGAFLVYHHIPRDPVDQWELYLGCIGGE